MRLKARLVIHGFKQRLGVDYNETYAPVIRFETIRAALYYAVQCDWYVLQNDVKTAFLYGDLEEVIFMEQPPAPNVWNKTLHAKLMTMKFIRLSSDHGLYMMKKDG
ncbi:Gag-pol Polyprotein [Phytophthora megakarya]|uniref:Gag-pol Polyprotein n=1 Tax=Phytophthora megakarya TaxID=4795 RepID=A0A225WS05_9STRA|nr:Gag-pol Polyprotein [Phytophthora megakarya]